MFFFCPSYIFEAIDSYMEEDDELSVKAIKGLLKTRNQTSVHIQKTSAETWVGIWKDTLGIMHLGRLVA